jgi:hypothetical protein
VNEEEQERFETELRRVAPASVSAELMARLRATKTRPQPAGQPRLAGNSGFVVWFMELRWLVAATPVVIAVVVFTWLELRPGDNSDTFTPANLPGIKATDVRVDHALVTSFEAVAELPGGEPVRFQCREWRDQVQMRDSSHGLTIEQSSPRIEVIPVRFETY